MSRLTAAYIEGLDKQKLLTLIMLRRVMHAHDGWCSLDDNRHIAAFIFSTSEFIEKNVAFGTFEDVYHIFDLLVEGSEQLVSTIYMALLSREATAEELADLHFEPDLSLAAICGRICWTEEFLSTIRSGAAPTQSDTDHRLSLTRWSKFYLQDQYNLALRKMIAKDAGWFDRKSRVLRADTLQIHVVLFDSLIMDRHLLNDMICAFRRDQKIELTLRTEADIIENGFGTEPTLFISNNNFLYADRDAIFDHLQKCPNVVSVCWLFDNHHQFDLSMSCANIFDIIYPAHCNGTEYLYGYKAVIGAVVPCATIQWSHKEVAEFYPTVRERTRSNTLYGRFSSYEGRVAARDHFLRAVSKTSFGHEIKSLKASQQDWYMRTPLQRFEDFASFKVAVSTPILNDIPIRIFDSLVAGQIPIVPFGSLGLETAISLDKQQVLPILTYFPNDLRSLETSYERAIAIFDEQGQTGADFRHDTAMQGHLLVHRVSDIVRLTLELAAT